MPKATPELSSYTISAGLIRRDWTFAILLLLVTSVPVVFEVIWSDPKPAQFAGLLFIGRFFEIIALSLFTWRWHGKLNPGHPRINFLQIFLRIAICGFATWSVTVLPSVLSAMTDDQELSFIIAMTTLPGCVLAYLYYFYCIPLVFGVKDWRAIIFETRLFTAKDRLAPVKVTLAPMAIMLLLVSLAMVPSPDGQDQTVSIVVSMLEGIFIVLSAYASLGYGLLYASDTMWRSAALFPYKEERLRAMASFGPLMWAAVLKPRNALKVMTVALLVLFANLTRQLSAPPTAKIEIAAIALGKEELKLTLNVKDDQYNFRGFRPAAFKLASQGERDVSTDLLEARVDNDPDAIANSIPSTKKEATVTLRFKTNRTGEELRKVEDLWLWYNFGPLMVIPKDKLESATVIDPR